MALTIVRSSGPAGSRAFSPFLRKQGFQLRPEGELSDVFEQGVDPLAALAVVHELEKLLEHTRRGARRRHELHNGQSGGGPLVTFGGRSGLSVAQRQHAVAG